MFPAKHYPCRCTLLAVLYLVLVHCGPSQCTATPNAPGPSYTSQRALQLLANTWTNPATWPKRNETTPCQRDVDRAIKAFLNDERWALEFFDAWAPTGPAIYEGRMNFVGNYHECRNVKAPPLTDGKSDSFRGNYCVLQFINLTASVTTSDYTRRVLQTFIFLGTCMPDTCSEEEITMLVNERLAMLNVSTAVANFATECRTDEREYSIYSYVAIFIVTLIGTLLVLGTALDLANNFWLQPEPSQGSSAKTSHQIQGVPTKVLLSFSLYTNGKKLLNTAQPPGALPSISGIRVLTMAWVLSGHMHLEGLLQIDNAYAVMTKGFLRSNMADLINNFVFCVDTFFAISGILAAYGTIKKMQQKGWNIGWGSYILHRYWRLTPPYILIILTSMGLQRFWGSGASWFNTQPVDLPHCEQKWWGNLLYYNNANNEDVTESCFLHTWSMAVDFQCYIVSPLMIIPFYFSKTAGLVSCAVFLVASWTFTLYLSLANNWGHYVASSIYQGGPMGFTRFYYGATYSRIGPFVIGIITGYFLAVKNGRIKVPKVIANVSWIICLAVSLFIVFGFHDDADGGPTDKLLRAALMNAFARTVWGAIVCWVIVLCSSGYGGPINTFLTWPPFIVLAKISYMFYIVHYVVVYVYFGNIEQPMYLNMATWTVTYLGLFVLICTAATVLWLTLEVPTLNLEHAILGRGSTLVQKSSASDGKDQPSTYQKAKHN